MKRRDFIKLSAGLGATMAATTPLSSAFAQTKMVLKASDVHPLGYPTVEAVVRMGKKLEAATDGRLAQRLQQQAADPDHGRSQRPQGPHDGQSALRRYHERAGRQRRRAGLRSGFQLDANGRGRRRREQSAIVHGAEPLSGSQVF